MKCSNAVSRRMARAALAALATFAVATVTAALWPAGRAAAKSLYVSESSPFASMYADTKASKVGDIITILITENSYAQNKSQTQTSKGAGVDVGGAGALDFIPAVGLDLGDSTKGSTQVTRQGRLIGTMTAQVVEVLPNGDLLVQGNREVSVNREKEQMTVTGTIRPRDIAPNNTINSSLVANAQISFTGGVYTGEKGGFFKNLWDGIVTFFNWIF